MGRLHGPLLPGNHKYCLRFYYLLYGFRKVDNALALYIYDENNVALEKVWSLTYSSKAVWTKVEITYMKPMLSKVGIIRWLVYVEVEWKDLRVTQLTIYSDWLKLLMLK